MLTLVLNVGFSVQFGLEQNPKSSPRGIRLGRRSVGLHNRRPCQACGLTHSMHNAHRHAGVVHGPVSWAIGTGSMFYRGPRHVLHDLMVACILDEDLMATGYFDFDLDMISIILGMFDDDCAARSLLGVK